MQIAARDGIIHPNMSLQSAFRLSFYLTLGMACTCLASAETYFFDWTEYSLLGVLACIGIAYWVEGRWHINQSNANHLGLFIAMGAAGWILYSLPRSEQDVIDAGVPWPAGLLPHLGPLLVLLLLVKLFRPKHLADFWVLQAIALMMATLGCVLASDLVFGLLLVVYVASLIWCLSLYYMVREQVQGTASDPALIPLFAATPVDAFVPWRLAGLWRVTRWTAAVVLLGLFVFMAAPREGSSPWLPHSLSNAMKLRTGMDPGIDLNRTGMLDLSDEPAFHVLARTHDGPVLRLPANTRWFVEILEFYQRGAWLSWEQANNTLGLPMSDCVPLNTPPDDMAIPHPRQLPQEMPSDSIYLLFYTEKPVMIKPLAYPLGKDSDLGIRPYLADKPSHQGFFQRVRERDMIVAAPTVRRDFYYHGQVIDPNADPDLIPARDISIRAYPSLLVDQEIPDPIRDHAKVLLKRVPGLKFADRELDSNGRVPEANRARVASAFSNYLALSGEYSYTLNLERQHRNRDPTVDFLLYVKEGHCERFSGGLTLLLRSIGIPSRIVKGYNGLDNLGAGNYVVRQDRAHSWVQALVRHPETNAWSWLTLDPTPSEDSGSSSFASLISRFKEGWSDSKVAWRIFVVDYNADVQRRSAQAVWQAVAGEEDWSPWFLWTTGLAAAGGVGLAGWWMWRRLFAKRRNRAAVCTTSGATGWYRRLLRVLDRQLDMRPALGQTPLEIGRAASQKLAARPDAGNATEIPLRLAQLLYSVAFGGKTLSQSQEQSAEADVARLERFLKARVSAAA